MLLYLVAALLFSTVFTTTSALDYNDYALQRIARAPHPSSALLVPYPRVGKRSDGLKLFHKHLVRNGVQPRFIVSRAVKRAFVYAPRK